MQDSTKGLQNWKKINPRVNLVYTLLIFFIFFCPFRVFSQSSTPNQNTQESQSNQISKKSQQILKSLRFGTSSERKAALVDFEKLSSEEQASLYSSFPELLKKEKEPSMKIAFLKTIGNAKIPNLENQVFELLEDKNEEVARQALTTIRKLKYNSAWEKILERLKKEDLTKNSNLTVSLIEALMELEGGENAANYLEARLKESFNSPEIRAPIALYMGRKKIQSSESLLQKIAFDEKEAVTLRTYSIYSLGKINSISSIPKIRELLDELRNNPSQDSRKSQLLKVYCLAALVDLGADNVMDELIEFSRDDDSFVRYRAIQLLADSKREEAREILEYKSIRDPSPRIQKYAKERLEKWNEKESTSGNFKEGNNPSEEPNSEP